MKEPIEYLEKVNAFTTRKELYDIGKQIQIDAYNQAVDDCIKNAEVDIIDHEELKISSLPGYDRNIDHVILPIYDIDDESLLKLKK